MKDLQAGDGFHMLVGECTVGPPVFESCAIFTLLNRLHPAGQ